MQPDVLPDYQRVADGLGESELNASVSEAHGMLCGLLCAGEPAAEGRWLSELFVGAEPGDLLVQEAIESLRSLAGDTREDLEGPGLGFTPLLPEEECPLQERAFALYDWVRGFLYGLGLAGLDAAALSGPAKEVFDDFVAITRMDLAALGDGEDEEQALAELQEFVWVAAMLVYEERGRHGERR